MSVVVSVDDTHTLTHSKKKKEKTPFAYLDLPNIKRLFNAFTSAVIQYMYRP
jgi:hypothetical protein